VSCLVLDKFLYVSSLVCFDDTNEYEGPSFDGAVPQNTRETAMALKGMSLKKAKVYLQNVLDKKDVIPLRRFCGSAGRSNLCKNHNYHGPGRFPEKSVRHLQDLLTNAESNAEMKSLETDNLYISHIQVNQAQHGRRRTYRAHGRINAYMSSPCHVEVILTDKVSSFPQNCGWWLTFYCFSSCDPLT
jgi:large subunit ribosomal protein L17e